MTSHSAHPPSLLLDLPAELVGQILSYDNSASVVEALWKSGSPAMQSIIARNVDLVRLRAEPGYNALALPSFLKSLVHLRELSVITPNQGDIAKRQYLSVLKNLNSSLEALHLDFEDDADLFKPRALHFDLHPDYSIRGRPYRRGGAARGGRGGGRGGGHAGNDDSDESNSESSDEEVIPAEPPFDYINLRKDYPNLQKLSFNSTRGFINGDEILLPTGLTWLDCNPPSNGDACPTWAAHLPRNLTYLRMYRDAEPSEAFFSALPPSLTGFFSPIYKLTNEQLLLLPRSLKDLMYSFRSFDQEKAIALPPGLQTLTFDGNFDSFDISSLKSITALHCSFDDFDGFTPEHVQLLPRTLTLLDCAIANATFEPKNFPPKLKQLHAYGNGTVSDDFSAALPPTLTSFSVRHLPVSAVFYSNLPAGLTYLGGVIKDVEPENFSLPPGLLKLHFWEPCDAKDLSDRDAWTAQDTARFASMLSSPTTASDVPVIARRPFPFRALPRSLTEITFLGRPVPISALRHFPLLLHLEIDSLIEDEQFDPADKDLLQKANEYRLYGQTMAKRAEIVANPLTHISSFSSLLPPSLNYFRLYYPLKVSWKRENGLSAGIPEFGLPPIESLKLAPTI